MEFVTTLFTTVIPFLIVLTIVVFFHELGHFLVARWNGVTVTDFSIGFGKEIFGFDDKHGTRWRFCWLPLGGYVKFIDDENAASVPDGEAGKNLSPEEQKGSFHGKSLAARSAIVAAGPIANFILAIVIFAGIFTFFGEPIIEPRIGEVVADSAADKAGFREDDVIAKIDGTAIESFTDMQRIVSTSAGSKLVFVVMRGGHEVVLNAVPERKEVKDRFGNKMNVGMLGVRSKGGKASYRTKHYNPVSAVWKGTTETWFIISQTMSYLGKIIMGNESAEQLGGPIRIAQISGQAASVGILPLVNLIAVLSVSIGLINLFPIPMLDGGHLLFYFFEAIKGEPLSEKTREYGFRIGLALVLMLMIFVFRNDLIHLNLL